MENTLDYFAFHDYDKSQRAFGGKPISQDCLSDLNAMGYGIFYTPNILGGDKRRCAENIIKIRAWYCDIDKGTKEEQLKRINNLVIYPSFIVESAHGFHCYWMAKDATKENFKTIVSGIIQQLDGDQNCTDVCRLLRVPWFYHQKDPNNPFLIRIYKRFDGKIVSEKTMLLAFKPKEKERPVFRTKFISSGKNDFLDENNIDRIFKPQNILAGSRNDTIAQYAIWMTEQNLTLEENLSLMREINRRTPNPLDDAEIRTIVYSKY